MTESISQDEGLWLSPDYSEKVRLVREWRTKRYEKFAKEQETKQQWVCLARVLDLGGNVAYRTLLRSFFGRAFQKLGRTRVLYLHPWTSRKLMDVPFLTHVVDAYSSTPHVIREQYLCHCWVPYKMADDWCQKNGFELKKKSPRGRKKGKLTNNDVEYISKTMRFVAAGLKEREAVRAAVRGCPEGDKGKALNRVRKKYREGLRK
jgi:hypothetical protein